MEREIVYIATDWWGFGATLITGLLSAIATMSAVIYTNNRTKKQLKDQEIMFENERKKEFKQSKFVIVKPMLILTSFTNLLDRLIVENRYDRILLFSGEDGFDFYDDWQKQSTQRCRMLQIVNKSDIDIKDVVMKTKTTLRNMNTDELLIYNTNNSADFLRGHESIVIRVKNQEQFEKILSMNSNNVPSALNFECKIEYTTLANQRITYTYKIEINNDRHIEVKKDGVEDIRDLTQSVVIVPTIFRNLQDSISHIDRYAYSWEKMGQAQMRGIMSQYNPQVGTNQALNDYTDSTSN